MIMLGVRILKNRMLWASLLQKLRVSQGKKGRAKRDPIVHDAMEILLTEGMAKLYEKMDELNASQLLKLVQISALGILP